MTTATGAATGDVRAGVVSDLQANLIRTITPVVVGSLLTLAATMGLSDRQANRVRPYLEPALIFGYYAVVRVTEKRFKNIGWLLGYRRASKDAAAGAATGAAAPGEAGQGTASPGKVVVDVAAGEVRLGGTVLSGVRDVHWERGEGGAATLTVRVACPDVAIEGVPSPREARRGRAPSSGPAPARGAAHRA